MPGEDHCGVDAIEPRGNRLGMRLHQPPALDVLEEIRLVIARPGVEGDDAVGDGERRRQEREPRPLRGIGLVEGEAVGRRHRLGPVAAEDAVMVAAHRRPAERDQPGAASRAARAARRRNRRD